MIVLASPTSNILATISALCISPVGSWPLACCGRVDRHKPHLYELVFGVNPVVEGIEYLERLVGVTP